MARRCSPLTGLGELLALALSFSQRVLEECFVDPPLEDRHTELHALGDDFAPVQSRLPGELGGREVNRHGLSPRSTVFVPNCIISDSGGQLPRNSGFCAENARIGVSEPAVPTQFTPDWGFPRTRARSRSAPPAALRVAAHRRSLTPSARRR